MCNTWVKRLLTWDKSGRFKFAPLEGKTARDRLPPFLPGYLEEDTIVLLQNSKVYLRSDAAFRIVGQLPFPYRLLAVGKWIPKGLRDKVYDFIAGRRYTYGPRYDQCPLPPPSARDRFLP